MLEVACTDGERGVTDRLVERTQFVEAVGLFRGEQVHLVEDQQGRHAVGFGSSQEAVDEDGAGLGMIDGDEQCHLVEVGGDDMTLLAQVGRSANDIIPPVLHLGNPVG